MWDIDAMKMKALPKAIFRRRLRIGL